MAARTVMLANEHRAGTIMKSESNATEYKPQPQLKSVVKPPLDKRSRIKHTLADLGVVTKTNVEEIVENLLSKCKTCLQS